MPRLSLRPDQLAVDIYFPAGHADSLHVEPGDVIDVPGDLAPDQPDDAYVIGTGDDARAWPKALWDLADAPAAPAAAEE